MSISAIDISVIIINYNTFELTCNCISSIHKKSHGVSYEIIIVDNASTEVDADRFKEQFPDIILVKNDHNQGFAKGNNEGLKKARGKYVLLLNSDAQLKNDALAICRDFLDKNPAVGPVTAKLIFPDGRVQHNCQRFPSIRVKLFELLRLQKFFPTRISGRILLGFFFKYDEVVFPDWIWGTFFMFKRSIVNELPDRKLADEFFMYVEDMQWCMEFRRLGYRIAFVPKAEVIHFVGQSGGARPASIDKNIKIFMGKYYGVLHAKAIAWFDKMLS
jgi:GT2 family glycosyltransferase